MIFSWLALIVAELVCNWDNIPEALKRGRFQLDQVYSNEFYYFLAFLNPKI
jgi:hypothetical protein